jgi:hypothetical protein
MLGFSLLSKRCPNGRTKFFSRRSICVLVENELLDYCIAGFNFYLENCAMLVLGNYQNVSPNHGSGDI